MQFPKANVKEIMKICRFPLSFGSAMQSSICDYKFSPASASKREHNNKLAWCRILAAKCILIKVSGPLVISHFH